jgi:anti-sigma B factor antagonist
MTPELRCIETELENGILVIRISESALNIAGAIDGVNREIVQAIDQFGAPDVLLDFQSVTIISSLMLGKLVRLQSQVSAAGSRLILCNLQPQVNRVFAIARLTKVFEIKEGVADSLAFF